MADIPTQSGTNSIGGPTYTGQQFLNAFSRAPTADEVKSFSVTNPIDTLGNPLADAKGNFLSYQYNPDGTNTQNGLASTNPQANISTQSLTTLSSNKASDIARIQDKTKSFSDNNGLKTDTNTGITTDASGKAFNVAPTVTGAVRNPDGSTSTTYSDGSVKQTASVDGTTPTGGYFGDTYVAPGSPIPKDATGNPVALTQNPPSVQANIDSYQKLMTQSDALTASLIANTQQSYEQLIKQQEQANTAQQGGLTSFLIKNGSLQGTQSGQGALASQISYGLQQISGLQTKENAAIIAAQQAGLNQDFQLQGKINDTIDSLRKEKQTAIQKQNDDILKAQQDLAKEQFDTQKATTDSINSLATEAAKNGASPSVIKAISGAKTVQDAITAAGDSLQSSSDPKMNAFIQEKRSFESQGLTPPEWNTFSDEYDAKQAKLKVQEAYNTAFASASGKAKADSLNGTSDKVQQQLEQQARGVLAKEFSSRSGTYGLNDAKVSQANKLAALFNQSYDPKTGNYNINAQQYGELAQGLASLVSNSPGGGSDADVASIKAATAKGDWNKVYTYVTGSPANGSSQEIINSLANSVQREAQQAEQDRQVDENKLVGLLPTDLDPARKQALIANASIPFIGINGIAKKQVDSYVAANKGLKFANGQDVQQTVAAAYTVPGTTDQDVWDYIQRLNSQ